MLIGEVARRSGVSARMLRHYDALGLVRPTGRTVAGYREYTPDDIRRILYVEGLRFAGLSLGQIARALEDPGFTPSALIGDLIRKTEERLAREHELLERLHTVDATGPADWRDVARVVELLRHLGSPNAARRQQAALASPGHAPASAHLLANAILSESDPNVAGALRWALARSGGAGATRLAAGLTSGDPDVRRRAVAALAELPGDDATAALNRALRDTEATIRGQAALALGARGVTDAVPELVSLVVTGLNDVEAAEHLGAIARDPSWAEPIMSALSAELFAPAADSAIRMRLTQALAEMPGTLASSTLHRLTHDDDRPLALFATALLGTLEA
ncbi:MerR family transcriptional regulator [Actinoplanes regularis]|uniref:DNA-binding transcriptional regulator, MerR family n=1 Tax=Actinoplanes regularis TaxID=52697 RepID=A0A239JVV9_9ACTN|nr:MerR family transcriptional regulator [Actinoplanes regularis]GIE92255.1 MerR family transcriptional regulator [Actinoplanes regularis]SNT10076.1 DNA-binding transcriptional regulator, MerR family [Actinoplanes regularis]